MERTRRFGNHIEKVGYREKLPHLVKRQANCSHARRRARWDVSEITKPSRFYLQLSISPSPSRQVRSQRSRNRSSLTLRVKYSGIAKPSPRSPLVVPSQSRHDAVISGILPANEPRADARNFAQKRSCHESEDDPSLHPRPRPGRVARVLRTRAGPGRSEAHGPDDGSWENVFLGNEKTDFQVELTWNRGRTEPYDNGGRDTHLASRWTTWTPRAPCTRRWAACAS